jgi:integrase
LAIHKLSPAKVKNAGPGKYDDGGGLKLVVSNAGAKKWVLRFTINGKRREMGLGSYPTMLGEARNDASDYRKLVTKGVDPIEARRIEQVEIPTFTTCAAHYIRAHRRSWKNAKHARQWVSTLKTYARPEIGTKKVDVVTTEDILKILQPIWTTKTETAKRLQGRIENILDFAAAHKYRDHLNPARWRGHLDKLLAKPSRVKKVTHHPAMPYSDVPAFMTELLAANGSTSALALQFLILTATRTSEVLQAKWEEVDLEKGVWTIPAERMKARREHRAPLSDAALNVLAALPRIDGHPYLFPGSRHGRPLSNMALLQLMRGMGYGVNGNRGGYVPHGFRSSFRDWAGEITSFPRDVAEMALAHAIKNKVEAAYRRGDLFTKRRNMMQEWGNYLENLKAG